MGTMMLVLAAADLIDESKGFSASAKEAGLVGSVLLLLCGVAYMGYLKMYRPEVQGARENQKEQTAFAIAMKDAMASYEQGSANMKSAMESLERTNAEQSERMERVENLTRTLISVTGSTGDTIEKHEQPPSRPRRTG